MPEFPRTHEQEPNSDAVLALEGGHATGLLEKLGLEPRLVSDIAFLRDPQTTDKVLERYSARHLQGLKPGERERVVADLEAKVARDPTHLALVKSEAGLQVVLRLSAEAKKELLNTLQHHPDFSFPLPDELPENFSPLVYVSEKNIANILTRDSNDSELISGQKTVKDTVSYRLVGMATEELRNKLANTGSKIDLLPLIIQSQQPQKWERLASWIPETQTILQESIDRAQRLQRFAQILYEVYYRQAVPQYDIESMVFLTDLFADMQSLITKSMAEGQQAVLLSMLKWQNILNQNREKVPVEHQNAIRQLADQQTKVIKEIERTLRFVEELGKPDQSEEIKQFAFGSADYLKHVLESELADVRFSDLPPAELAQKIELLEWFGEFFRLVQRTHASMNSTHYDPVDLADYNAALLQGVEQMSQLIRQVPQFFHDMEECPRFISRDTFRSREWQDHLVLVDAFFHDVGGVVSNLEMAAYMAAGDPSLIREMPDIAVGVETSVAQILKMMRAFNLREGKIVAEPELMSRFKSYLENQARKNADMIILEEDIPAGLDLNQLETPFNTPLLFRVIYNSIQNTTKAYRVLRERLGDETVEQDENFGKLRIRWVVREDAMALILEDFGPGFPQGDLVEKSVDRAFAVRTSPVDGATFIPYVPEKGKTEWSSTVSGTGTGLDALRQGILETFSNQGGDILMGTVVEDQHIIGARLEIIMPVYSAPPQTL